MVVAAYLDSRAVRVKLQVPFDFAQGRLSPTLPRIFCPASPRLGRDRDVRKSGSAADGMTKLRAVAHLGMSGGGWKDSKKLKRGGFRKLFISLPTFYEYREG